MTVITQRAARRFLLIRHGLLGSYRFIGKEGALSFVRQCGCIQFDPVDVCGRNAELTLQSRVKGFTKQTLAQLLYRDRLLFDYPDKELSILPIEDWPFFHRFREAARRCGSQFPGLPALEKQALEHIARHGPADAASLPIEGRIHWHSAIHWSGSWHGESNAARSVLEQMYSDGRLVIHHKDGARKTYDIAARCLPPELLSAPDPLPGDAEHLQWRILRRIGAVGLLHDRNSDALLGIRSMTGKAVGVAERKAAFEALLRRGEIREIRVEGVSAPFYYRANAEDDLALARSEAALPARCEFLAPLDPMLWDRKLIAELFDFHYRWEIYTPAPQRKYGYYVLPVVYGERLAGRIEAVAHYREGALEFKNLWLEDGVRSTKQMNAAVQRALRRFARFNGCAYDGKE